MFYKGSYAGNSRFIPGQYFSDDDITDIIDGACEILEKTGLKITDDIITDRLRSKGYKTKGNRLIIDKSISREYLKFWQDSQRAGTSQKKYKHDILTGYDCKLNEYCSNLLYKGDIKPFTLKTVTEMTKFVQKAADMYGFSPNCAGTPSDVPYKLQSLACFMTAAKYCKSGYPDEPTSIIAAKYMFDMADVMEYQISRLTVYVSTPLMLGGESLDMVLQLKDLVPVIKITSMPAFGATTPLSIPTAFSLAFAEVLGSAVLVNSLTDCFCDLLVQMHPFDPRALNIVFGSPEHLIFEWISGEFNAKIKGKGYFVSRTNLHTHAKTPGTQSCAEKASLAMAGAIYGAAVFTGAGALSLDEIFSPAQLVLDLEILCHIHRSICGLKKEKMPENISDVIAQGLDSSYLGTDLTLDNINEFLWYPKLFERKSLESSKSMSAGEITRAEELVDSISNSDDTFILDESKSNALDRIWSKAISMGDSPSK